MNTYDILSTLLVIVLDNDIKLYPSSVQLNKQKVTCTQGLKTKYFERFFCRSINNTIVIKKVSKFIY